MKRIALTAVLAILGLLAVGGASAHTEQPQAASPQKEMAPFFREFDKGLEAAVAKGQHVFVDFYTDW
ncbi:MAG: hypothetical protein RBT76_11225 [candidate division Zixibacteria bacterium]|jgi:thiol:disulfide interchange protein|nr:hypothetical protein [candidate division Zixibacteria bacterium]